MVLRTDPFRDLARVFDQAPRAAVAPLDAYRDGDLITVEIDLPGVDPAGIDVTVDRNVLTVRAERVRPAREGVRRLVAERATGTVTRRLVLADTLDTDRLTAGYDNGVLTLTVPVAEKAKPRKIEINRELVDA